MTWSGSPGTGMPQPPARSAGRDTEKSSSPPSINASTSFRRPAGSIRSRPEVIADRSGPAYRDSRKNQFSSVTRCGTVERLAAGAVQPVVPPAVQVAGAGAGPPETFDARPVPGVAAGADDVVDGQRQGGAQGQGRIAAAVYELA